MSGIFNRTTGWIVDKPLLSIGLLVLITALSLVGHFHPDLLSPSLKPESTETEVQTVGSETESQLPPDVEAFEMSGFDAIVVVESDHIFTPSGSDCLREIVAQIESLAYVRDVVWMDRVPPLNIFGLPEPILPGARASEQKFEAAFRKAMEHPFVRGQMLSEDGRTALLLISFDFFQITDDTDCIERLTSTAVAAAEGYPDSPMEFFVTGRVPVFLTAMKAHDENQFFFQIIGYGMVLLAAVVLFRGIVAVGIVALAPALAVFWTIGIVNFFGYQNNPFNSVILPVLVSMVGLTDGVHLMVQIRRLRAEGMAPRDAARTGIYQVGLACALTSLTTAIGFGSLSLARHEWIQQFGHCCVVGVGLAFVAVVTTIPLCCASPLGKIVHRGREKSLIDRNIGRISQVIDLVLKHPRVLSVIAVVATVALIATCCLTLRPDERQSNTLPEDSEALVALRKMDEALGGLEASVVVVEWDQAIESDSAEVLEVVKAADDVLGDEPLIGNPLSMITLLEALPGDGPVSGRMSMLELLPPPIKRSFFTPESRRATITFRVQDLGIRAYSETFLRVEKRLAEIVDAHPSFEITMAGSAVWRWRNLYQIVVDLALSLGTASLIIFVVLGLVYRSFPIGLISIVPNLFPLAVAGAWLVVRGESLEVVTVCAFTVCLGIAVDDTIHFLTRYQEERASGKEKEVAIRDSFTGVGTALIVTTVILVAGFATVMFSDSHDHHTFAVLGTITISAALFADLVFLPALLARFMK